ncbi:hypothetical protein GGR51DRAFT_559625 [Nemania sp. FL0031]|nr:hypothetical protein GGR51DRAFT_559625 [Nemania sp. FL0031]
MDSLTELESLEEVARQQSEQPAEPYQNDIERWQRLFGFSYDQARGELIEHRSNLSRAPVSEPQCELARAEKEAEGYDKEAYEYFVNLKASKPLTTQIEVDDQTYLLRIDVDGRSIT